MYNLFEFTCPVLGFCMLAIGLVVYLLYNTVTVKADPVEPKREVLGAGGGGLPNAVGSTLDYASAGPPRPQRIRFLPRWPGTKVVLIAFVATLAYSIPAWLLLAAFFRVRHMTVHFVDAATGQPVTQPLDAVGPDRKLVDPNSPDVIVQYQPTGVAEITWRHGDFVTITVQGYQTWGGDIDDMNLSDDATVVLTPTPDPSLLPGHKAATRPATLATTNPAGN
jgi:hypothetical protein